MRGEREERRYYFWRTVTGTISAVGTILVLLKVFGII